MCSEDSAGSIAPPGFNKRHRDISKLLLGVAAAALITNANAFATATSAGAILVLKQGTLLSHKNCKWGILSVLSFAVSLSAAILMQGHAMVDDEKAYGLKLTMWLMAKFMQVFWSVTLGIFLLSAFSSPPISGKMETPSLQLRAPDSKRHQLNSICKQFYYSIRIWLLIYRL